MQNQIDKMRVDVGGTTHLNRQLAFLGDAYKDLEKRALEDKKKFEETISNQRFQIEQLYRRSGRTRSVSAYYGFLSTEDKKQIDSFLERGFDFVRKESSPYKMLKLDSP